MGVRLTRLGAERYAILGGVFEGRKAASFEKKNILPMTWTE
jgi:hypothetical protein